MSRSAPPNVATPRMISESLAVFYVFGGAIAVLSALGSSGDLLPRIVMVALGLTAALTAVPLARWGSRLPRGFFHLPVAAGTLLITLGVHLSPEPTAALACASISAFTGMEAYFFFSQRWAVAHLGLGVALGTGTLVARGDVPLLLALVPQGVIVALGIVTLRLVVRASDADRDALTGLANRRGFDRALQELMPAAFRSGERLSVALLDLDHFKQVNDTLGHDEGDRLLCRVAQTWGRELPRSAVLARHGGDEFALLLPATSGPAALALVERLTALHPDVGVSCGVAQHLWGESAAQVMRRADTALYAVKAAGRGRAALHGVVEPEPASRDGVRVRPPGGPAGS